jgi:hypothetical protein
MKIYVAAVKVLKKKEIQDQTQFTTEIGGKTSLSLVKFSFPVTRLMPYYAETGYSHPLHRLTLWVTLLTANFLG